MAETKKKPGTQRRGRPRKLFDRDIAKDRLVSKWKLDDAAEEQADAFGYWSDLAPAAKKKIDNLELDITVKIGDKFSFYKEALDGGVDSKGNVKQPTDTAVNMAVNSDEEIVALRRELADLQEYYGLVQSAIKTMDMRRSSIKVLNELNTQKYFESANRSHDEAESSVVRAESKAGKKAAVGRKLKDITIPEEEEVEETPEPSKDVPTIEFDENGDDVTDYGEPTKGMEEEHEVVEEDLDPEEPEEPEAPEEPADESVEEPADPVEEVEKPKKATLPILEEADNPCPHGHIFGEFGQHDDCDECDNESACFRESKKH